MTATPEIQARLAIRSVMAGPVNGTSHEDGVGPSQIHRRLKAEFDDVLRTSMQNRLKNLREEVEALCNSLEAAPNGDDEPSPASSASRASAPDTKALCETVAKALRRAKRCSKKPITSYGPSDRQVACLEKQTDFPPKGIKPRCSQNGRLPFGFLFVFLCFLSAPQPLPG